MPRIRTIKPEFWDDDAIGALSRDARLLFIAVWNFADDEGLIRWSAEYLKASVFMYDDIDLGDVLRWMRELEEGGFVYSYASGRTGQRTAFVVNFRKHQRIDKPQTGRLPPPRWQDPAVVLMYARRDSFTCHLCGEPVNAEMATRPADPYDPETSDVTGINPSPDHLVPRSKGGSDYPTNIRTAHVRCNKGRSNRPAPKPQVSASSGGHSRNGRGTVADDSRTIREPSAPEGKGREGMGRDQGSSSVTAVTGDP